MPLRVFACRCTSRRCLHASSAAVRSELGRLKVAQDLLAQFEDPSSPFLIPPGASDPSSPDGHSTSQPISPSSYSEPDTIDELGKLHTENRQAGISYFKQNGWDTKGILEWPVAWGDCDMFQHANNVQYVRWFESTRIKYAESFAEELPESLVVNMLRGKGTGFILKDVSVRYRLPVTYPDTLIIASRPHSINQLRASFGLAGAFWSLKSSKLVATADSTMVMYDYDNLKKGVMIDVFRDVLLKREKEIGVGV